MQAQIILEYTSAKVAQAVADAVSPDNHEAPQGLTVETRQNGAQVITDISINGKLATFISTIDDLLESASTAEKALHIAK